jgi:alginate O-acetyltransferase complex protein AlgI
VLFTESTFLFIFLPTLIVLHVAVAGATTRDWLRDVVPLKALNALLLAASLAYFILLSPVLAALLTVGSLFTYGVAIVIDTAARRGALLAAGVTGIALLMLGARYVNALTGNVGVLALPLKGQPSGSAGVVAVVLSFFCLQATAYLIEAYRRRAPLDRHPIRAGLSLLFFPFLLAGPIVRRNEIQEQLVRRMVTVANFAYGMRRFSIGLFKKIAIADAVGITADAIFGLPPAQVGAARAWLGLLCFALQIYFAVSAYSDMALGLGRMFGFRLSENFKWPYVSTSVHEFWEKWFISVGQWLRDYLRLPLNAGPLGKVLLAFALIGAWHGTRWTFALWAAYHAAFVTLERLGPAKAFRWLPLSVRRGYVLAVVVIGWVFFRAESVPAALSYLTAMAGMNVPVASAYYLNRFSTPELWFALTSGIVGAAPLVRAIGRWRVAIDGATTAVAVMAFAVLVYIWGMGVRLVAFPRKPSRGIS